MKIEIPFQGVLCVEAKDTEKAIVEVMRWGLQLSESINMDENSDKYFYLKILVDKNHPNVLYPNEEQEEREKAVQEQQENIKPFIKNVQKA